MSQSEDPAAAAARLETALERLERIAAAAASRAPLPPAVAADPSPPAEGGRDMAEIAGRLDALIARLRAGLAAGPAEGEA